MAIINPPAWMQAGTYDARTDRLMVSGLIERDGVVSADSYVVTQSGTPGMSVSVSAGTAYVSRSGDANLGMYAVRNDGAVTAPITTADSTNARIDLIIVRVYDAQYTGVTNTAAIEVIAGSPSASPVAPALPATAVEIARVTVGAGVSSIVNANISTSGRGRARLRTSMAGPDEVTSSTRPSSPVLYNRIYETDTKAELFHNGTQWVPEAGNYYMMAYLPSNVTIQNSTDTVIGVAGGSPASTWTTESAGITYNSATGEINVPLAGIYEINVGAVWDSNTSGAYRLMWIDKNGSGRVVDSSAYGSYAASKTSGSTRLVRLAANDKLRMHVFHAAGGPILVIGTGITGSASYFDIKYIRA